MSMLAERKRKQKWSLNPRGQYWSNDSNKFGQRMLEKMGWSQGKGLGASEDGVREHVKVSYKNDSKGIGYSERNDQWTEHESNFSELLESLSGNNEKDTEIKLNSLEEKSQSSRVRVHYHKFTRGKDLSRYSEKDLANIFGKRSLKEKCNKSDDVEENEDDKEIKNEGSFVYSSSSMLEYFKTKLPTFGKKGEFSVGNNGVLCKEGEESESDVRTGFGFTLGRIEGDIVSEAHESEIKEPTLKKKAKKFKDNNEVAIENPSFDVNSKDNNLEETFYDDYEVKRKKKKLERNEKEKEDINEFEVKRNKKSKKKINNDNSVLNDCGDSQSTMSEENGVVNPNFKENNCEDTINENGMEFEVKRPKKNKRKCNDDSEEIGFVNPNFQENNCEDIYNGNEFEVMRSKKNKKKINNDCNNDVQSDKRIEENEIANSNFEENCEIKESKKTKKKSKQNNSTVEENKSYEEMHNNFEVERPKKSKKKMKNLDAGLDNPVLNLDNSMEIDASIQDSSISSAFEVKRKKKKNSTENAESFDDGKEKISRKMKKRREENLETAIDNPTFNADIIKDNSEIVYEEYEVKRKKKRKIDSNGIDNPNFKETQEELKKPKKNENENEPSLSQDTYAIPDCDLMFNIDTIPIKTPEPKQLPSPKLNSSKINSAKRKKTVRFSDVTQQRIIPNILDLERLDDINDRNEIFDINSAVINELESSSTSNVCSNGIVNNAFDQQSNNIQENIDSMTKTLDRYEAEIENDMNEQKLKNINQNNGKIRTRFKYVNKNSSFNNQVRNNANEEEGPKFFVGEVGNPDGENEKLADGTKLKFKYAKFGKLPHYAKTWVGPKKSYKHLIKGDIVLKFNNTNLHEIKGYAT